MHNAASVYVQGNLIHVQDSRLPSVILFNATKKMKVENNLTIDYIVRFNKKRLWCNGVHSTPQLVESYLCT